MDQRIPGREIMKNPERDVVARNPERDVVARNPERDKLEKIEPTFIQGIEPTKQPSRTRITAVENNPECLNLIYSIIPATEKILMKNAVFSRIALSINRIINILKQTDIGEIEIGDAIGKIQKISEILKEYFYKLYTKLFKKLIRPIFDQTEYEALINIIDKQYEQIFLFIDELLELISKENHKTAPADICRLARNIVHVWDGLQSRENTIVVNLLRTVLTPLEFVELSYEIKETIIKNYGKGWRKKVLTVIIGIEKELGISDLRAYLPIQDPKSKEFLGKEFLND